jgi:hypothetical protein
MKQYDEVKCPICGVNWFEHSPECCRHAYRPVSPPRPDWVEEMPGATSRPDVITVVSRPSRVGSVARGR